MPQLFSTNAKMESLHHHTNGIEPETANCDEKISELPNFKEQEKLNSSFSEEQFGKFRKNDESAYNVFRRTRTTFTSSQVYHLEKEFVIDPYISRSKRKSLAQYLRLPEITIKVWFQNRRMKDKRTRMNTPWQYSSPQPLPTTYGNPIMTSSPIYTTYPLMSSVASTSSSPIYQPMPYCNYTDITPVSYSYPLYTNPQETWMPDASTYTYTNTMNPSALENGPAPLSTAYRSSSSSTSYYPYYHPYSMCNTCSVPEIDALPLNLDTKSLKSENKESGHEEIRHETGEIKSNMSPTTKPAIFRPFEG